jgi:anhydro-N-acetylmuramic acid kinase
MMAGEDSFGETSGGTSRATFRAIGVISGTSMDAIDVALIRTDGKARVEPLGGEAFAYPEALRRDLIALIADPARAEHDPLASIEARVTDAFADAVEQFLTGRRIERGSIDLVGLHGQTILHRPERRFTRQLGDGARLAGRVGIDVVNRFRHADVAAGGQGAPLVPLYHAARANGLEQPLIVLNLGGVANITYLHGETIIACDTGPASALIDDAMRRLFGEPFDRDGAVAARGKVHAPMLAALMDNPFFAAPPPKSLDRNDFHARAAVVGTLPPADQIATLTAFTIAASTAVLRHLPSAPRRWLVTGGGRLNRSIMDGFAKRLGVPVEPVEAANWNGDLMEAECFGYLAARSRLGLPLSLPTTTGVPAPMRGGEFWPARARG